MKTNWTFGTIVLGATLMCATVPADAQSTTAPDPAATPSADPLIASLQRQKEIEELRRLIAEAEKARFAASLPTTEGSGISGSATFGEKSGYFAELLAYAAAGQAAHDVARKLGTPGTDQKVLIVANSDLAGQAQRWEIARARLADASLRLEELDDRLDPSPPQPTTAAAFLATGITAAAALLGAAADVGSFFRSDFTATAKATNVTATALTAEAARHLRSIGWKPILPSVSLAKTRLLEHVEELLTARHSLLDRRRQLEQGVQETLTDLGALRLDLAAAKADVATAKAAKADAATVQAAEKRVRDLELRIRPLAIEEARWQRTAAEIDAALAAADVLVKALLEGVDGKPSPLESVAVADVFKRNASPDLRVLQLELSSQGGEVHVTKSVWRTRVTYLGGAAVTYLLMDEQGSVLESGFVTVPVTRSVRVAKVPTLIVPELPAATLAP